MSEADDLRTVWHALAKDDRPDAPVLVAFSRIANALDPVPFETMEPGDDGWTEWIHPLPGYLMKCCDCGLVHELDTDIDGEGRVLIRMRRPTQETDPE